MPEATHSILMRWAKKQYPRKQYLGFCLGFFFFQIHPTIDVFLSFLKIQQDKTSLIILKFTLKSDLSNWEVGRMLGSLLYCSEQVGIA